MGNLVDIIGYTGKVTDCRCHFRTDALTDLTIHCRLMAKFIDRQSCLFRFVLDVISVIRKSLRAVNVDEAAERRWMARPFEFLVPSGISYTFSQ